MCSSMLGKKVPGPLFFKWNRPLAYKESATVDWDQTYNELREQMNSSD